MKNTDKTPSVTFWQSKIIGVKKIRLVFFAGVLLLIAGITALAVGLSLKKADNSEVPSKSGSQEILQVATWGGNNMRNKVYTNSGLNNAVVSSNKFGRRTSVILPLSYDLNSTDSIYAQPLAYTINSTEYVLVVTTGNNAYVIDGLRGSVVSAKNFGLPHRILEDPIFQAAQLLKDGENYQGVCLDIADYVGIVGTPVVDLNTTTAYFFSIAVEAPPNQFNRTMWFHAVDAYSLQERAGFPVRFERTLKVFRSNQQPPTNPQKNSIAPFSENNPTLKFDPNLTYQRPALLLHNGIVYGTFGGHCDLDQGWSGWFIGVDPQTGQVTTSWSTQGQAVFANGGGAIWMSGAGPAVDEDGNIYLTTGTGLNPSVDGFYDTSSFAANASSNTIPTILNEAFVKLEITTSGSARPIDYFLPSQFRTYDYEDFDFGAGGPLLLPEKFVGPSGQRLAIAIDKPGRILVMNRDNLGGFNRGPSNLDGDECISMFDLGRYVNATQQIYVGYFNTPTIWSGEKDSYLYVSVKMSNLFALRWNDTTWSFEVAGHSDATFSPKKGQMNSMPGMPVVTTSADGSGSALVWVTDVFDGVYALNAQPDEEGLLQTEFHDDGIGQISRFATPGISQAGSGLVYVATNNGTLVVYGALNA
ncbi:hypothetical protein HDU84_007801 [Entophlyctis sp. JEL0112]|nr:hypothetical protein HDU84_007801 [Entophlyctis sp. JEL0112]